MDDTTQRAAFPFGDTEVILTRPTDSQLFVLALSRTGGSQADQERTVRRILRVVEKLIGPDAWADVVEEALIEGHATPEDLMRVVEALLKFDWNEGETGPGPVAAPEPVTPERTPRRV